MVYGEGMSRIRARSYTVIFMACDLVSLVVQAGGGGLAASVPLWNQNLVRFSYVVGNVTDFED